MVVALAAVGLYYFLLPTVRAHRFVKALRAQTSQLGPCEATVEPIDLSQLLSAKRTVRVETQFGLGFKRSVFLVTPHKTELQSEEIPADEWMWGLAVTSNERAR